VAVEAPAVPASTDGGAPAGDREAVEAAIASEDRAVVADDGVVAAPGDDRAAVGAGDEGVVAAPGETAGGDREAVATGDDGVAVPGESAGDEGAAVAADDEDVVAAPGEPARGETAGTGDDGVVAVPGETAGAAGAAAWPGETAGDDREAVAAGDEGGVAVPGESAGDDREAVPAEEPARSGNGVPAAPPAQIPRATPRPQPRPGPAAPLRADTPSRVAPAPPRRSASREGGSRAGLYTLVGLVVLAAAIAVPVYFMVLNGDDEPAPEPNPIAEPGGTPTAAGGGAQASEARAETVVVVLNGTPIDGLASRERDTLLTAGYSDEQGMIRIDNNQDQACQDSIVYFGADERRQARDVSRLLDITRTEQIDEETQALADSSDETGTLPADVVALLCADKSP
jgi:hypothetical protein